MSIFCIVLAVFLVTTIFGMADMFIRSQILQAQMDGGNFHVGLRYVTDEDCSLIAKRPAVKAAARYGVLNYRGEDGYTLSGKTAIIMGCDAPWFSDMMVDGIAEGNFPQTESEAMLTQSAKDRLGFQIGDTVVIDGPDGEKLTYIISGFCKDAMKTTSEDSIGVSITTDAFRSIYPAVKHETLEDYDSVCYVQFENPWNARREIQQLKADLGLSDEQVYENVKLMGMYGQSDSSKMMQIYVVAAILFVLVLAAGVMMIASSLNSNVAQRTEFFGLMRCIGATPKQVIRLVRKEALLWCRFGNPGRDWSRRRGDLDSLRCVTDSQSRIFCTDAGFGAEYPQYPGGNPGGASDRFAGGPFSRQKSGQSIAPGGSFWQCEWAATCKKSGQHPPFQGGNGIGRPSCHGKQEKSDFDGGFFCAQHHPVSLFFCDCGFYEAFSDASASLDSGSVHYQSGSFPVCGQRDSGKIKGESRRKSCLWADVCL